MAAADPAYKPRPRGLRGGGSGAHRAIGAGRAPPLTEKIQYIFHSLPPGCTIEYNIDILRPTNQLRGRLRDTGLARKRLLRRSQSL